MIQYQFTATRLDNGEPVTGNFCQLKDGTFIVPTDQYGEAPEVQFISVDPATVRRVLELGDTESKTTVELWSMAKAIGKEADLLDHRQSVLNDIVQKRLMAEAIATRPWKIGDRLEVYVWRKRRWIEGICTDEVNNGGRSRIATITASGKPHKSNRLQPDDSADAYFRFGGKSYVFDYGDEGTPGKYKEVVK